MVKRISQRKTETKATDTMTGEIMDEAFLEQQFASILAKLTTIQRVILKALIDNLRSGQRLPETKIAENLGIHRTTIWRCKKDPSFTIALATLTKHAIHGRIDQLIGTIQRAAIDGDWRAAKFLLQYIGAFTPRSQKVNVRVNITSKQSSQELVDNVLMNLLDLGVSPRSVYDRMIELRNQGI